jgi:hypothetical protein
VSHPPKFSHKIVNKGRQIQNFYDFICELIFIFSSEFRLLHSQWLTRDPAVDSARVCTHSVYCIHCIALCIYCTVRTHIKMSGIIGSKNDSGSTKRKRKEAENVLISSQKGSILKGWVLYLQNYLLSSRHWQWIKNVMWLYIEQKTMSVFVCWHFCLVINSDYSGCNIVTII